MASTINASNSGFGGIVSTGDSSGQLQLQTASTTAVTISSNQTTTLNSVANPPLIVQNNGTEAMRVDSSGNVGIGTSSPSQILHIQSSSPSIRAQETSSNNVRGYFTTASTGIYITTDYSSTSVPIILAQGGVGAAATERMRIATSGQFQSRTIESIPSFSVTSTSASTYYNLTTNLYSRGSYAPYQLMVSIAFFNSNDIVNKLYAVRTDGTTVYSATSLNSTGGGFSVGSFQMSGGILQAQLYYTLGNAGTATASVWSSN